MELNYPPEAVSLKTGLSAVPSLAPPYFASQSTPSALLQSLVRAGRRGNKTVKESFALMSGKRGIYIYCFYAAKFYFKYPP